MRGVSYIMVQKQDAEKNCDHVSIVKTTCVNYPRDGEFWFRPSKKYLECPYGEYSNKENMVYDAVRESFILLKLDQEHIGTEEWNPFADFINPGDNVLIKPNMVIDKNTNPFGGQECLYTDPTVVAPVLDYVFKALKGTGKVVVGDAPIQECNFEALIEQSGYKELINYYQNKGLDIALVDFRKNITITKRRLMYRETLENVPAAVVNLGKDSEFYGLDEAALEKLRLISYPSDNLKSHHHGTKHEYCVSQYMLDADVIINIPKLKTHKKAGITAALKNMVGINAQKDYLPHHMAGPQTKGGDEFKDENIIQSIRSKLYDKKYQYEDQRKFLFARFVWFGIAACTLTLKAVGTEFQNGSWYGNNTVSKMVMDINKIVFYANKAGQMTDTPCRKQFIVSDMIVAGEKNGPVSPSPKRAGLIVSGDSPINIDRVAATLMGFDIEKIPTLKLARNINKKFAAITGKESCKIHSNYNAYNDQTIKGLSESEVLSFEPAEGWKGYIELH